MSHLMALETLGTALASANILLKLFLHSSNLGETASFLQTGNFTTLLTPRCCKNLGRLELIKDLGGLILLS